MYSGLLPKGLTEEDLSPDDEEDAVEEKVDAGKNTGSPLEVQPAPAYREPHSESPTDSMPGISQEMWQKFQALRKRNDEMKTVKVPRKRKRRRHKKGSEEPAETRELQEEREKHWDELKQYFGVNDRFHPPRVPSPLRRGIRRSGLEKSIERAIAEGDIAKAEEMSDRLATRELAVEIAQAADCRDFVRHKEEEEASRAAQKRKKEIPWGFEAKKRWETKSNMGFM